MVQRCPIPLTSKMFLSPTTKDFQSIFRYLVQELVDPGMVWGKKFEDDVINLLKDLRYPAMETIGRTGLGAPGGRDWAPLLAMLNWLVELCKVSLEADIRSTRTIAYRFRRMTIGSIPRSCPTHSSLRPEIYRLIIRTSRNGCCGISPQKRTNSGSMAGQRTFLKQSRSSRRCTVRVAIMKMAAGLMVRARPDGAGDV